MARKPIGRREFLQKSTKYTAFAAAGAAAPMFLRGNASADAPPDIVVAQGAPGAATKAAVEALGGMGKFVKKGQKVVIKPNMSWADPPESATSTNPEVVRELVSMCLDAGASSVMVLDNALRKVELCLEMSGIQQVCELFPRTSAEIVTKQRFYQDTPIPKGQDLKSTMVMKKVLDADVLIAAPIAKSHGATGVTLGMKGMMGLIFDREVMHYKMDLDTAIVDLCTLLRPQLTVIDAIRILTDGGPGGPGKIITLNKVIASADVVAADAMATELGTWYEKKFKASQVKHIAQAHERGLGNMKVAEQVVKEVTV